MSKENRVSDERLIEMFGQTKRGFVHPVEDLRSILTELQSLRSKSLSTQQPMGEVTDKVWFSVLDCPHEITGNEIVLRYAVTKEGRNAADQLRMRISAALHPNQESGE